MLYDLRHDPWSLQSLIYWLEGKDPNGQYNYHGVYCCLLAQYCEEKFGGVFIVSPTQATKKLPGGKSVNYSLPAHFNYIAMGEDGSWQTFGGALRRARECLEEQYA